MTKPEKTLELTRLRIKATGLVQGVGYRWFVQRTARNLGLTGWVENMPDGSVELEAEGTKDALDTFLNSLRNGHPYATVDGLAVESIPAERNPKDFIIKD